jgi:hypothetical protein
MSSGWHRMFPPDCGRTPTSFPRPPPPISPDDMDQQIAALKADHETTVSSHTKTKKGEAQPSFSAVDREKKAGYFSWRAMRRTRRGRGTPGGVPWPFLQGRPALAVRSSFESLPPNRRNARTVCS